MRVLTGRVFDVVLATRLELKRGRDVSMTVTTRSISTVRERPSGSVGDFSSLSSSHVYLIVCVFFSRHGYSFVPSTSMSGLFMPSAGATWSGTYLRIP